MAASIGTNVVIISIVFSILAIISVFLKFRARLAQQAHFGADDCTVVPAMVRKTFLRLLSFRTREEIVADVTHNRHFPLALLWPTASVSLLLKPVQPFHRADFKFLTKKNTDIRTR